MKVAGHKISTAVHESMDAWPLYIITELLLYDVATADVGVCYIEFLVGSL